MTLVEIQHFRVFLVVAEELHFGRAAERLHMAQPPVTRIIQQLERQLGVALFERTSRSVKLTSAGEALIQPAQAVLDAVDRTRAAVGAASSGLTGRVRVGYSGASARVVIARLASAVRDELPGVELHLHSQTYPRLVSDDFIQPVMTAVLRGELDIGIGRWDLIPAGVQHRALAVEGVVMALGLDHRLAGHQVVSMQEFRDEPIVSTPQTAGSVTFDRLLRLSYAAGFEPKVVQTAPDTWGALALVAAGLGSTLVPSGVAESVTYPGVVFVPVTDEVEPITLRMAWRRDRHNPAIDSVLRLAEQVLPSPG